MAVAFDASSRSPNDRTTTATTSPIAFDHTPAGTPRGVIIGIVSPSTATGAMATAASYGGVALSKVATVNGTSGENQTIEIWFLGAGLPTGVQSVSVTRTVAVSSKIWVVTVTASMDTAVDSQNNGPNTISTAPSLTVTHTGSLTGAFGFTMHAYGGAAAPNLTASAVRRGAPDTLVYDLDTGNLSSECYYRASVSGTSSAYGYSTLASDDQLLLSIVVKEAPVVPRPPKARRPVPRPSTPGGGSYS